MGKIRTLLTLLAATMATTTYGQTEFVKECQQRSFTKSVPAGNYSGITRLHENTYAVVSDKSETDGFFIFNINIDSISGEITSVENLGFKGGNKRNTDCESIVFVPSSSTLFISREGDNRIAEYTTDGLATGRMLTLPDVYLKEMRPNSGIEAFTYDERTSTFWTVNECTMKIDGEPSTTRNGLPNLLRLVSFGSDLLPDKMYFYETDAPGTDKQAAVYTMGVSEILAADSNRILVLEREFFVPKAKIGAYVNCKLYETVPTDSLAHPATETNPTNKNALPKRLVHSFKTRLNITNRSLANYEGMCFGPKLADGSATLVLVSDSQNRYAGILKDFFKTIILR